MASQSLLDYFAIHAIDIYSFYCHNRFVYLSF